MMPVKKDSSIAFFRSYKSTEDVFAVASETVVYCCCHIAEDHSEIL